jgi:hypothetical protein
MGRYIVGSGLKKEFTAEHAERAEAFRNLSVLYVLCGELLPW